MKPRIEQKLEFNKGDYLSFLRWLKKKEAKILYPERIICSRYFDTLDLRMYYHTLEGIVPRKKIRIRTYNSDHFMKSYSPYNLEIKMTTETERLKTINQDIDHKSIISNGYYDHLYGMCFEQADITYVREYYSVGGIRVTIDKDIKYKFVGLSNALVLKESYDDSYVLEIKAGINTNPSLLLNKFNFPRSRFSKYERAIESLINI